VGLLLKPRDAYDTVSADSRRRSPFARGLITNLLNPKVGVFYMSFLPQFVPAGANLALGSFLLACVHVALSLGWFALIIGATASVGRFLRRPGAIRWLDRATGLVLVGFGLRLAASSRS
jgi:threonine/homoserine/homoserine lactone efflux protein